MLLVVGQIGKPHGVRGEVSVDRADRRARGAFRRRVGVHHGGPPGPPGERRPGGDCRARACRTRCRPAGRRVGPLAPGPRLVAFEGVYDRDVAEELRGVLLQVDSAELAPPDDPDEFHDHQLVGLRRRVARRRPRSARSTASTTRPSSDLLVLGRPGGGTALIPFVSAIVPDGRPGRRPRRRRPARGPARPVDLPTRCASTSSRSSRTTSRRWTCR